MKKLFTLALAFAALASCNTVETLESTPAGQIAFDNSFVEIKTREAVDPSITTATIDAFDVWAIMDANTGVVFEGERVSKGEDGVWSYSNLQYWMAPHNYYFFAVAPVDDANITVDASEINPYGIGKISFVNEKGSCDLLYTEKKIFSDEAFVNAPQKVSLQFGHLLSKLKFSFTNCFTNENSYIVVKNITITDAPKLGEIALNVNTDIAWQTTAGETTALVFGDVEGAKRLAVRESGDCATQCLTIPADNTRRYNIEFDVELYNGDQLGMTSHKVVKLEGQAFEIGKQYALQADITPDNIADKALQPIEFDVITVNSWDDGDINGKFDWDDEDAPVALATPVVTASVDVNVVTLTWEPVEGAASYTVQVDDDVVEPVSGTTYTFEGDYEVEYTFTVKAIAADAEKNLDSEAAVVKATTEAKPVVAPTYTTVAEFLAAPVNSTVEYTLKGTITSVTNTTYGNFDLTDETGTVYIWGLCSPTGEQKYWATSKAKLGDDIIIKTVRAEYNGSAQGSNAKFVELITPGTLPFWAFSKDAVVFGSAATEEVISVEAYNLKEEVKVVSDNAQFTAAYADGKLTISAAENTSTDTINGNITISAGTLTKTITVAQSGVSVGGGTEVTASVTMANLGYANAAAVKEVKIDDNVTVKFAQGKSSTAPAFYTSGNAVRLYQNGATMTVTANGKTIKSIEIKFAQSHYYMAPNCGEFSAEGDTRVWTGDATEILFTTTGTDKNHRAYIAAMSVTYID
mgnify:CR=1 FL=1